MDRCSHERRNDLGWDGACQPALHRLGQVVCVLLRPVRRCSFPRARGSPGRSFRPSAAPQPPPRKDRQRQLIPSPHDSYLTTRTPMTLGSWAPNNSLEPTRPAGGRVRRDTRLGAGRAAQLEAVIPSQALPVRLVVSCTVH